MKLCRFSMYCGYLKISSPKYDGHDNKHASFPKKHFSWDTIMVCALLVMQRQCDGTQVFSTIE